MQSILQARYYDLSKRNSGKYLVQTRSQVKSSGITLVEVHGVGKGLYPNIQPEKQVIKPVAVTKVKEVSEIKPRLGQGRAGLRHKIKVPVSPQISKPNVQVMEKPVEQPKVQMPETSRTHDKTKTVPMPDKTIPHISSRDDSGSRTASRRTIQDINRELPSYPNSTYRPPPKPVKMPIPKIHKSLLDIDPEVNMDFEKKITISRGCDLRNVAKAILVILPRTTRIG